MPFNSWVGGLDETPENGCVRQRHRCMLVVQSVTDRVPAEAGEVWQQIILISRTAGEKAFANADILLTCAVVADSRGERGCGIRSLPETTLKCAVVLSHSVPLAVRGRFSSSSPFPLNHARVANDG